MVFGTPCVLQSPCELGSSWCRRACSIREIPLRTEWKKNTKKNLLSPCRHYITSFLRSHKHQNANTIIPQGPLHALHRSTRLSDRVSSLWTHPPSHQKHKLPDCLITNNEEVKFRHIQVLRSGRVTTDPIRFPCTTDHQYLHRSTSTPVWFSTSQRSSTPQPHPIKLSRCLTVRLRRSMFDIFWFYRRKGWTSWIGCVQDDPTRFRLNVTHSSESRKTTRVVTFIPLSFISCVKSG